MTSEYLELILDQHGIHPNFWAEMKALVFQGVRPGRELWTRLHYVTNYKTAYDSILAELSKQNPCPPVYESLEISA